MGCESLRLSDRLVWEDVKEERTTLAMGRRVLYPNSPARAPAPRLLVRDWERIFGQRSLPP